MLPVIRIQLSDKENCWCWHPYIECNWSNRGRHAPWTLVCSPPLNLRRRRRGRQNVTILLTANSSFHVKSPHPGPDPTLSTLNKDRHPHLNPADGDFIWTKNKILDLNTGDTSGTQHARRLCWYFFNGSQWSSTRLTKSVNTPQTGSMNRMVGRHAITHGSPSTCQAHQISQWCTRV